jgi:hypothetical protein
MYFGLGSAYRANPDRLCLTHREHLSYGYALSSNLLTNKPWLLKIFFDQVLRGTQPCWILHQTTIAEIFDRLLIATCGVGLLMFTG